MDAKKGLNLILIDDEEIVHQTIGDFLADLGHTVEPAYNGISASEKILHNDYDAVLLDLRMPELDGIALLEKIREVTPSLPVIIITGHGNMETVIEAMRLGATDFMTKPIRLKELEATLEKLADSKPNGNFTPALVPGAGRKDVNSRRQQVSLVGKSKNSIGLKKLIEQAVLAKCDSILITGETGTGKETVARKIHSMDKDLTGPLIVVSCPALSESTLNEEFFGRFEHSSDEKSSQKIGYFEAAHNGTLVLDEVCDLSVTAQGKLLRALETRRIKRLGIETELTLNVKIIATTHKPIQNQVEQQLFREDLYYRLNVFHINIPPLRERKEDIIPLVHHFLKNFSNTKNIKTSGISDGAKRLFLEYSYPGNVRELKNIVERAAILALGKVIRPPHLEIHLIELSGEKKIEDELEDPGLEAEKHLIVDALKRSRWNRRKAAEFLGIPYSTLRFKISKLGL